MIESKTLNLWERIAEQQAYAEHPNNVLTLPMLQLIDSYRNLQKTLIDFPVTATTGGRGKSATQINQELLDSTKAQQIQVPKEPALGQRVVTLDYVLAEAEELGKHMICREMTNILYFLRGLKEDNRHE